MNMSVVYGLTTAVSFFLAAGYLLREKKKNSWLILLYVSVFVVNLGYLALALSGTLDNALMANRIAYLGSVFLPLAMLMVIGDVCEVQFPKKLTGLLLGVSVLVFLIAASPGYLDIYYKEVTFVTVGGASALQKVYGPLHGLYGLHLLCYFAAMVAAIVYASVKKKLESAGHAVILAIAVLANIGVWFVEQLSDFNFEFLSISYIISELFLLGVHIVMNENRRLKELVMQKEEVLSATEPHTVSEEMKEVFARGLDTLTPTERVIYEAYISKMSTKEVMSKLSITENTLKFHNKNLYGKLGVSSRKKLLEIHGAIKKDN